jgi:hypothetical protein
MRKKVGRSVCVFNSNYVLLVKLKNDLVFIENHFFRRLNFAKIAIITLTPGRDFSLLEEGT